MTEGGINSPMQNETLEPLSLNKNNHLFQDFSI